MSDITLNFINRSNDTNNSSVVIFQKNQAADFNELAVAWTVIQNCGFGDNHPFKYPLGITVGASDSWGNFTPQQPAEPGMAFEMVKSNSGDVLQLSRDNATSPLEYEIKNALPQGGMNAHCYRDNRVCASKTGLAPGQKAVFSFEPRIWIGVVSQVVQGDVLHAAIVSDINTEINLLGISSADIVMTGGGSGPDALPFQFTLENINAI
ncbi:hypothetical protein [Fluviicola sp.]|uniref:hypothetical protein n=1 Tax=Fluviicola sp. TaxID=1917219 RepID=UPI0031E0572A